ncbi:hypothetical protein H7E67_03445 [Clostridium gasigenes]|uniref:hypothetical protein n=1 Tax=Clostridium gasigenes TaxID=94869 RepID=UPI0016259903|nr:hypothetical protein [Clostridium gasigenes]MBB6622478.1 hypothetical protein [Clostridium gasigenes]
MSGSYKTIYWGLLLIAFNFYLGNINVLPDFLGFIMISKGLRELGEVSYEEEYFRKAKVISNLMIVITLIQYIIGMYIGGRSITFTRIGVAFFTIGNFVNVITLVVIYYILKGIYAEVENRNLTVFMGKINNVWNFKLVVSLITFLACAFIINAGDFTLIIMTIVAIIGIVATIRVALVVKEAGKELS